MMDDQDDDDDRDEYAAYGPGGLDDEYRKEGCVLGEKCCCPHIFHTSDECFDAEWAEQYFADAQPESVTQ